jgi:hypothetical protein
MSQKPDTQAHSSTPTSRPGTPRSSSETYTPHLRNISRLSLDSELLHISPASLSPLSTPRPGSPTCHSGFKTEPATPTIFEPYKPAPAMTSVPRRHVLPDGTTSTRHSWNESRPPSSPCTPTAPSPAPSVQAGKQPVPSPLSTRPPPRRVWQPDAFENRTRWTMRRSKHKAYAGYCCGLCDEKPVVIDMCGGWLTGVMTTFLAGATTACCAAALSR